jgi:hypothetical protein
MVFLAYVYFVLLFKNLTLQNLRKHKSFISFNIEDVVNKSIAYYDKLTHFK